LDFSFGGYFSADFHSTNKHPPPQIESQAFLEYLPQIFFSPFNVETNQIFIQVMPESFFA
jgi:hypothetical protein